MPSGKDNVWNNIPIPPATLTALRSSSNLVTWDSANHIELIYLLDDATEQQIVVNIDVKMITSTLEDELVKCK